MIKKLFVMLVFFAVFLSLASAQNEVYVSPNNLSVNQSQTFSVDVNGLALASTSDVFGVQFDLIYDTSKLSISSVVEGSFLNNGSTTIFDYSPISGGIRVYNVRNATTGIYGEGSFATVNFNAIGSGSSLLTLSNVIWVNSTITNESAETISVSVTNGSVIINQSISCGDGICNNGEICSTCAGDCGVCATDGDSGGGGGGGSTITKTNATNQTQGSSNANVNPPQGNDAQAPVDGNGVTGVADTTGDQENRGFLSLTGNIIGNAAVSALRSWVFYFILGIVIAFVSVLLVRKHKHHHSK